MNENRYDFPIYNGDTETIPAFSIVKVKASDSYSKNGQDFFVVDQPDATDPAGFLLTSPQDVSAGKTGHALSIFKGGWVNYTGSVSPGDEVGPTNGSWSVSSAGEGLIVWLVDSGNNRCWIVGLGGGGACADWYEFTVEGNPTGGTFTWDIEIDSTSESMEFDYNSTAAAFETELETHSKISNGDVTVEGGPLPNVAIYVQFGDLTVTAVPVLSGDALTTDAGDPFDPQPKLRFKT